MLGTFALKLVVFWSNLPSLLSMAITGAYYGGSPPDQKNDKTIPVDCAHLAKNATGKSMFQIKTSYISLPSFLNPLRGSIYITWFFSKGFSGSNYYNTLPTAPFIRTLGSDKRRCFYFGDRPWASIVHFKLLWCFKLLLVSKTPGLMFSHGDRPRYPKWRWLMGEGPFVAGISLMWRALVFGDRSQLFPSEGDIWDCFAVHSCASFSRWLVEFEIKLTWYFLSEHGSETRHGKDRSLARSSEVRVYLWSECSGVVTDTLTLFRWL